MNGLSWIVRKNWCATDVPRRNVPTRDALAPTLTQRDEFNASRDAYSYPPIPDATEFAHGQHYRSEVPAEVHGWQWSVTFGRWSALVTFADGWHGFTFPRER